jgi:hypothetical protein
VVKAMVKKTDSCPFLTFEGKIPECKVKRMQISDGKYAKVEYVPLVPIAVNACHKNWRNCPTFQNATKKVCLNCGAIFIVDNTNHGECPECGS